MICAALLVKNETDTLERCLTSIVGHVDHVLVIDTGSDDVAQTRQVVKKTMKKLPSTVVEREWRNFGANLTELLKIAGTLQPWVLRLDADMTVEWHADFGTWFAGGPDRKVDAWQVELIDRTLSYRLPLLTRSKRRWTYVGATHEYLMGRANGKQRPISGITVTHHADGVNRPDKLERDLALLREGVEANEPRAVYYTAQTLRDLGRVPEAILMYARRSAMMDGWEEERWHAAYQAATLAGDVDTLIAVWRDRPHRHEPLTAAGRIVASRPNPDLLFNELP